MWTLYVVGPVSDTLLRGSYTTLADARDAARRLMAGDGSIHMIHAVCEGGMSATFTRGLFGL